MVVVKFLVFVSEVVSIFSKILTWIIGGGKRIPLPHQLSYWGARAPAAPLSLRLWTALDFIQISQLFSISSKYYKPSLYNPNITVHLFIGILYANDHVTTLESEIATVLLNRI